jgi:cytoskeletal protein RodZ
MSQTLGEKLREAREKRGISISEVAEQTRISPLYITSIEKDDYKPLPGGIFNKGFVKSYAKFIGIDEHEALQDYSKIVAETEGRDDDGLTKYRPEVLTDDNAISSMVPTIIFAGIILALMTGGILFAVNYLQNQPDTPTTARNTATTANTNIAPDSNISIPPTTGVPTMAALKVDFTASTDAVSLSSVTDGKSAVALVAAGSSVSFEPRESLKLSYSKSLAQSARLLINGRQIELPLTPKEPRRAAIEFEINKDNLAAIWESGRVSFDQPTPTPVPTTVATPDPDPTAEQAEAPTPGTATPRPTTRPATPRPTPKPGTPEPVPTRKAIVVGNANRP